MKKCELQNIQNQMNILIYLTPSTTTTFRLIAEDNDRVFIRQKRILTFEVQLFRNNRMQIQHQQY
jgi:hypothetical protein